MRPMDPDLIRGRFCGQASFTNGFGGDVTANSLPTDRTDSLAPVENFGGDIQDLANGLDVRANVSKYSTQRLNNLRFN